MFDLIKTCLKIQQFRKLGFWVILSMLFMSMAEQCEILWVAMLTSVGQDFGLLKGGMIGDFSKWISKTILHESTALQTLLIVSVPVALFKAASLFWGRFLVQKLSIQVSRELRDNYFAHLQQLPMKFFQQYHIGSLSQKVTGDSQQIAISINSFFRNVIITPFKLLSSVSFCLFLSWKLSLVILVGFPLLVIPLVILTKKVRSSTRQLMKNQELFSSTLLDYLSGIQTVKMFSMESFSLQKYKEENARMAFYEQKAAKYDLMTRPILHSITSLCLAGIILTGLYALQMSVPDLIAFCGILHLTYDPIKKFAEENASIQRGVAALERMVSVMEVKPQQDHKECVAIETFEDSIVFDKVSFKYEDQYVLRDVSFSIKRGETVAIVGATGSGKSTILNLLPRLYEGMEGDIRIDGKSIRDIRHDSLRNLVSYVTQKPFLFFDTIRKNISLGKPLSEESLKLAASQAYADEFIDRLTLGYDTHLSETGKNLSGGQQQRLALARALAKKSPILLLDEATSQLDAFSEEKVKQAVENMQGKLTQIIVAHRLKTVEKADRIIMMKEGKKLGEGTKETLYQSCPEFKTMWDLNDLSMCRES
ncbi:ABC transporter ATP-binding protein [bacterium]|nr:ABC transporter ATP-binding protein [bacterium]